MYIFLIFFFCLFFFDKRNLDKKSRVICPFKTKQQEGGLCLCVGGGFYLWGGGSVCVWGGGSGNDLPSPRDLLLLLLSL
jgi:hypothetical protein